ncbi:Ras-GEF domain-containing protein [Entamoeba marina]
MEQSHFLLLQTITTYLCMHNNSSIQESFIQRLAYVTSEVLNSQLNEFFTVIKSNIDQIFELESIEPYYFIESNSRSIIAASANTMFELIFDDNYHEPQYMRNFIYFLPFIMKHRETYDKIMQYYNTFCNEHPSDTNSQAIISWKFTRLERLIQSWLEIMSSVIVEVEPIFFQEMLKTPLLTSDQLSILFKKKFKKILGDIGETTICIPEDVTPYTNNSAREILMTLSESSSNNETQLKILLETFSIDPIYSHTEKKSTIDLLQLKRDFFAEQLILFEFQSFQNVHCHDFYISRKTTTLNTYIAACQKIEYWAMSVMDILKKPDTYGFFIKVAKYCFEKKGYNTCYLLYSTLTQQSMNCDSENGLPLFSVWMHDIVNINTIPSKIENSQLFNFCKMRAIGSAVTKLISAQRTVFPFKPHQTVIKVLNDIFVPPN